MNKKSIVKLGACSLLVGLLALTACGKKTTAKPSTTAKPITKTTEKTTATTKTTKTTKKTTKKQTTTEDTSKKVVDFNVYVDDVLAPTEGENAVIAFTYLDGYDYASHISVEAIYDDDTKEEIDSTKYKLETDLTATSECASAMEPGAYSIEISYGELSKKVNIDVLIYQQEIDISNLAWSNATFTYNGSEQELELLNIPTLPTGMSINVTGNKGTNAGNYTALVELVRDNKNYVWASDLPTGINNHKWTIDKLSVDTSNIEWAYDGPIEYSGAENIIELDETTIPEGVQVIYTDNEATEVGTYKARATFVTNANVEYSNAYIELDYEIIKCDAKFVSVSNPTRVYNGEEIEIEYVNNVDADVTITYRKYDEYDEEEYSSVVPVDAGAYQARLVIEGTDNYNGCEKEICFTIEKQEIALPNGNYSSDASSDHKNIYIVTYTGSEQELVLEGFDEDVMEFYDDDLTQSEIGVYEYIVGIKEEYQKNYRFENNSSDAKMYYYFKIIGELSSYVDSIKYNDETISLDDFEDLELTYRGDKFEFSLKEGYSINFSSYTEDENIYINEWGENFEFEIVDEFYDTVYSRKIKAAHYSGIEGYYINGKYIDSSISFGDYSYMFSNEEEIELQFVFNKYINLLKINYEDLDYSQTTYTFRIDELEYGYIDIYTETDENQSSFAISLIDESKLIVKSIDVISVEVGSSNAKVSNIKYDGGSISGYFYGSIVIGLRVNFASGYEFATYKIIDEYTSKELDFYNCRAGDIYAYLVCYDEDGKEIDKILVQLTEHQFELNNDNFSYSMSDAIRHFRSTDQAKTVFEPNYIPGDVEVKIKGTNTNEVTYTSYGIYRETIEFKWNYIGFECIRYMLVDVIYSPRIKDYADNLGFILNTEDGDVRIYDSDDEGCENIINKESGCSWNNILNINDLLKLTKDDLVYDGLKDGYTLDYSKSSIEFVGLDDKEQTRVIIKYALTKDEETVYLYAISYHYGYITDNTKVEGEKITGECSILDIDDYEVDIVEDTVTIENSNAFFEYEIDLEEECHIELRDGNGKVIVEDDDNYLYFHFNSEGTYLLIITTNSGATRTITITVTGNFGNVFETSIGDGELLYYNTDGKNNMAVNVDYDTDVSYITGFYGASSASAITSTNTVDVYIGGLFFDRLYMDEDLTIPLTSTTTTFNVMYSGDVPYINAYMYDVIITLYLADKPEQEAVLTIDEEEYGIIHSLDDLDNPYHGDLTEYIFMPLGCSTLTLTTEEVYDDYSYALVFITDPDVLEGYDSYSKLEEDGLLYRVTDNDTLSVNVDLSSYGLTAYMGIVPKGSTDSNYNVSNWIQIVVFPSLNIFTISNGVDDYYADIAAEFDGGDVAYDEDTNAYQASNLTPMGFNSQYVFFIGFDEYDNIDSDGYYNFTFTSSFPITGNLTYGNGDPIEYDSTTNTAKYLVPEFGDEDVPQMVLHFNFYGLPVSIVLVFFDPLMP
ncbi:MAG: hypothetical protein K6E24_01150 [bacterium]|nr:hypothetical protein [bacterium]